MDPLDGQDNGGFTPGMPPPDRPTNGTSFGPPPRGPGDLHDIPAPGELGLTEKRTWRTWQLFVGMLIACLIGLALNYHTVGASSKNSSTGGGDFALPTTTVSAPGAGPDSSSTTTTAAQSGSSTTTSSDSSTSSTDSSGTTSTTTSQPAAPARVLVGPTQLQGNWTSPAFTITAASWQIGWAFQCTPAPTAGASFQIAVVPVGSSPTGTPAVTETGATGQAVTTESSVGPQVLMVQAPANCDWAIKVVGS